VNRLDDEGAVQRVAQGSGAGEAVWCHRVRREAGIPDNVEIIADDATPMKPQVEIDALILVVELHEPAGRLTEAGLDQEGAGCR
jgi:hypothetical protein